MAYVLRTAATAFALAVLATAYAEGQTPKVSVEILTPRSGAVLNTPANVTLTAGASINRGNWSILRVEYYEGTRLLGIAASAPYAVEWANVAPGTYQLTARAVANPGRQERAAPNMPTWAGESPAVTIRVNTPPAVTLTAPAANAVANAPRAFNLTATATVSAPVAITVASPEAQIYYIHTDHLGTPRAITNQQREIVWAWANDDPFGNNPAIEDPHNTANPFTCNLRFPGQYFDKETGLHYNHFRDYDAGLGRYIQSDPIGLRGAINTYSYSQNDPVRLTDTTGLAVWLCLRSTTFRLGNHAYFYDDKVGRCCGYQGWSGAHPLRSCPDRSRGPGVDSCTLISTSEDDAKRLFNCCEKNADPWTYFPTLNDCQDLTDDCIRSIGMAPPGTPRRGRWQGCGTCWRR